MKNESLTDLKKINRDAWNRDQRMGRKRPERRITEAQIQHRIQEQHNQEKKFYVDRQEGEFGVIYTAGAARLIHCSKTNAIIVKLPYPVSANVMWRNVGKSVTTLSEAAREYKAKIKRLYIPLLKQIGFIAFDCPIEARIEVQPYAQTKNFSEKTFPRYDADNYQKCIFDALKGEGLIYIDDKQIVCPTLRFAEPATQGCVWVSIRPSQRTWLDKPVDFDWLLNLKTEAT
jgi:Holliday junction resolvase RusA-like endonuclease